MPSRSRIRIALVSALLMLGASATAFSQPQPNARIVFEVGTEGISSGSTRLRVPTVMLQQSNTMDASISLGSVGYAALYARGRYLAPPTDGGISTILGFLEAPPFELVESQEIDVLVDRFSVNLVWPADSGEGDRDKATSRVFAWLGGGSSLAQLRIPDLRQERWWFSRFRNAAGDVAFALEPAGSGRPDGIGVLSGEWEVRMRIGTEIAWDDDEAATLLSFERRVGEGTRRVVWQAEQLEGVGTESSLLVLAGNCVEGRSWIEGQDYNLHRPTSWAALAELPSPLMVPATTELAAPPDELAEEATAAGVTLISANLAHPETGELLFPAYRRATIGGVDTAVVGLTPTAVMARLTPVVAAQLDIIDPTEALLVVIRELFESEEGPPELMVLATTLERAPLGEVLGMVPGFDVILAPSVAGAIRDVDIAAQAAPGNASREIDFVERSPMLWAEAQWGGVGAIDVFTQDDGTAELRGRIRAVDQDWQPWVEYLEPVNRVRYHLYARQESILYPDLTPLVIEDSAVRSVFLRGAEEALVQFGYEEDDFVDRFASSFSWSLWLNYVANTVRTWADADVALVHQIPQPINLAGPIQELFVHAFLKDHDEVWRYSIPGDVLADILDARGTAQQGSATVGEYHPPVAAGTAWGDELVGGRSVDADARYRLAISSYLATQPDYADLLSDYEPTKRFRFGEDQLEHDGDASVVMLHRLIVHDLEMRRAAHENMNDEYLQALSGALHDTGSDRVPLFIFRIDDVALSMSQVSRQLSQSGFDSVRNSRVSQVDSLTLTASGAISGSFDTEPIVTTVEATVKYGELRIDEEITETADDLKADLDIQLRAASFWDDALMPYVTSRYDTELTPAENDDGSEKPRQSELRDSAGLLGSFSVVEEFRAGFFHQCDFAAESGAQSYGAELVIEQEADLGPVSQEFTLDAAYFFPSDDDTEEDLSFLVEASLSLAIPIVGSLSIETFVDTLWFRGQLPSNDDIGLSLMVGAGLRLDEVVRVRLE